MQIEVLFSYTHTVRCGMSEKQYMISFPKPSYKVLMSYKNEGLELSLTKVGNKNFNCRFFFNGLFIVNQVDLLFKFLPLFLSQFHRCQQL